MSTRTAFTRACYRSVTAAAIGVLSTCGASYAQFGSFGSSISDVRLNAQVPSVADQERARRAAEPAETESPRGPRFLGRAPAAVMPPGGPMPPPQCPLFRKQQLLLAYAYTSRHDSTAEDTDGSWHGVSPELYLETRHGLGIKPSFVYANVQADNATFPDSDTDGFGVSLALAQEILPYITKVPTTEFYEGCLKFPLVELTVNAEGGYKDSSSKLEGVPGTLDIGGATAGAGFTLHYTPVPPDDVDGNPDPTGMLSFALSPTYRYDEDRFVVATVPPARSEMLTIEGRVLYVVSPMLLLVGKVTWLHDLSLDAATGSGLDEEDWAAFEFVPIVKIGKWELRTAISYEAFHPDYDAWRIAEQIVYTF